jgi:hypothetical protein
MATGKNELKGAAAKAVVFGTDEAGLLVEISHINQWNPETERYMDTIEAINLTIVSPSTRFNRVSVKIPPDGYTLGIDDDNLGEIAENNGDFPLISFEGLTANIWTRRDSRDINITASAKRVFLCDESGNPLQSSVPTRPVTRPNLTTSPAPNKPQQPAATVSTAITFDNTQQTKL